ncbi:TetR/AcrR family transcriptional regulator [Pseudoalteromonas sp. 2CM32C]|uniref:TetR/AcrR family transcriptional regulator n=1 Tax=Pseudoalteromonas sp. 2CM32C TaxID=2929852 RepID=UPI0020C0EBEB|nr:TetR/AcrR family transcriptional regulator [Pseudoalteromonas sp. 2CM32C]MCK8120923.1 TetR/AcrR family transcriptional regulator [Pseudoalteromonas sp. 2CM32C]
MSKEKKASRGRPKKFDRNHVLDIAQESYWKLGINQVSINELCKLAGVSKPSIYREFGGEDGLMQAVLERYNNTILSPMLSVLSLDALFNDTLKNLALYSTSADETSEMPKGCLFANMKESRLSLGEFTIEQIDKTYESVIKAFEQWVDAAKEKGEFKMMDMDSRFAAVYIYAQISFAQSQMMKGETSEDVRAILQVALSVL